MSHPKSGARGTEWPLERGPYAFNEHAVLRIQGRGRQTYLWVGISSQNGQLGHDRCLGVLPAAFVQQLAAELVRRLEADRPVRNTEADKMGRAAAPNKFLRASRKRSP